VESVDIEDTWKRIGVIVLNIAEDWNSALLFKASRSKEVLGLQQLECDVLLI
jgi:hypothetical protein